jgi:CheY-like chemotaxis protein
MAKKAQVTTRLEVSEPLRALIDEDSLQQVLTNLVVNAVQAMPVGGELRIDTARQRAASPDVPGDTARPCIRIAVTDTGDGIPEDVLAHIFEPFFTTKPRGKGTGLGLATVYGIVSEAGGSINLYSELGVGTTFRIYLPLVDGPAGPALPVARVALPPPGGDGRTVLVVEDEAALARVVTRILTGAGYHVLAATTGAAAYALFTEKGCDAVLTDVIMPEMSGPRLAELVHERAPGLPVVYMSGYSNGLLGSTRVLDRDIPLLEKPFTAHDLLHKLHDALRPHEAGTPVLSRPGPSGPRPTGAPR